MIILLLSSNTPNDEYDGNNVNPNIPSNRLQQSRNEFDKIQSFHFGYHKVESFAALMAAIGML
jgi:hypothetical protein